VFEECLSYTTKGEAVAQGAFECGSHLWLQLSPTTSSHDPLHQAIPVSGHTDSVSPVFVAVWGPSAGEGLKHSFANAGDSSPAVGKLMEKGKCASLTLNA